METTNEIVSQLILQNEKLEVIQTQVTLTSLLLVAFLCVYFVLKWRRKE